MATATGKAARRRLGTRAQAKRAKRRPTRDKAFGQLPVSASRGNAEVFGGTSKRREVKHGAHS